MMDYTVAALLELLKTNVVPFLLSVGGKLLFALLVWLVGRKLIKLFTKMLENSKGFALIEATVRTFVLSFVKIGLNVILLISIIGIMGVPMSSVVAVVASAAAAVGLAMQGALSNLAGGIMLLIFRPFQQGDYIEAAGVSGTVREVSLIYTVLVTPDGKKITVPNGTLMNSNVIDYSCEEIRRVDVPFTCAKTEDVAALREQMLAVARRQENILLDDESRQPFFCITGTTDTALQVSLRVWCKNEEYWNVYFAMIQDVTKTLNEMGVQAPAMRVVSQ